MSRVLRSQGNREGLYTAIFLNGFTGHHWENGLCTAAGQCEALPSPREAGPVTWTGPAGLGLKHRYVNPDDETRKLGRKVGLLHSQREARRHFGFRARGGGIAADSGDGWKSEASGILKNKNRATHKKGCKRRHMFRRWHTTGGGMEGEGDKS